MYQTLLLIHSITRWLILFSVLYTIGSAVQGLISHRAYSRSDAIARVLTTTLTHTQLLVGMALYFSSPLIQLFLKSPSEGAAIPAISFFAIRHALSMFTAIVVMTVGSSLAKRAPTAHHKFRLTAIYFSIALVLILSAIPWPFLDTIGRPWIRF